MFCTAVAGRRCGVCFDPKDSAMTEEKFVVDLYIRVSTDRQAKEGDSLEEQESELRKFCEYRHFQIHKVFVERGKSGGNTNRPEYQKLVKDIEAKKINAVVVKKLDRLSRSLMDFEQLMIKLQAQDVGFISLRENFDTTMAMGKAMLRVALVFAQLEREQTAERIKDVFAWRAEQGLYNGGTRPFGYDSISSELVPHKQERKIVEFIFNTFLELKSTTLVAKECNNLGFKRRSGLLWDKREIHKILKRPIYKGFVMWNDQLHNGVHQPLITEATFEKIQDIFKDRDLRSPRNQINGLFKDFLVCGVCRNPMRPHYTKKKNGSVFRYYRCLSTINKAVALTRCAGQYIPIEKANTWILDTIVGYAAEDRLQKIQVQIDHHNKSIQKEVQLLEAEAQRLEAALKTIRQKKDQYLDSLVTRDFSKEERKKINEKIDQFSLEEKQIEAGIYRCQFEKTERAEQLLNIDAFKEAIVRLKLNRDLMLEAEIQGWLKENIEEVLYLKDGLEISFKKLKMGS